MGFLRFLKKGKKEDVKIDESLDIPPPPPSIKAGPSIKTPLPKPRFEEKRLPEEFAPFKFKEEK